MSWVQNVTYSRWSSRLLELDRQGNYFPGPDDDTTSFVKGVTEFPRALVVLGLIVALLTLLRICCFHPPTDQPRRPSDRLTVGPSLGLAFVSCILVVAGLVFFLTHARRGERVFNTALVDAKDDIGRAAGMGRDLDATGSRLLSQLDEMPTLCPPMQPIVEEHVAPLKESVARFMADIRRYNALIGPIPGRLQNLQSDGRIDEGQEMAFIALVAPLLLIGGACTIMVVAVLGAACFSKGSCVAQTEELCMSAIAPLFLAAIIILVTTISAGQLCVAISLSSFCADADVNFLKVLARDFGVNSSALANNRDNMVTTARYYVTGEGPNPILERVLRADRALEDSRGSLAEMELYANNPLTLMICAGDVFSGTISDINASLNEARTEVRSCEVFLEPENVYPYYQAAVHEEACGEVIDGFAWLAVFQLVVGLVFLPLLACSAAGYVREKASTRKPSKPPDKMMELERMDGGFRNDGR